MNSIFPFRMCHFNITFNIVSLNACMGYCRRRCRSFLLLFFPPATANSIFLRNLLAFLIYCKWRANQKKRERHSWKIKRESTWEAKDTFLIIWFLHAEIYRWPWKWKWNWRKLESFRVQTTCEPHAYRHEHGEMEISLALVVVNHIEKSPQSLPILDRHRWS